MRGSILAMAVLALAGCARPAPANAQSVPELAPFRSIALSDGGHVLVRHGEAQGVRVTAGEGDVAVEGTRLRIARRRTSERHERLEVEVVAPAIDALSVENGGRLVLAGDFPRQTTLAVAVSNGGMLDARALGADAVTASIAQGGLIYTRAEQRLDAAVTQGGAITYWGEPRDIHRAISHGGVVQPGDAADAERSILEVMPQAPKAPALPPVPPEPPTPR
jgi:hypothetical protein